MSGPIKSLTLSIHTNPYTVPVHYGDPRLCSGRCPAAPNTRGGLRARCSACNNNNNSTTAANRRSADRMAFLIGGFNILCCAFYHSIASFLVIMNIASYARPNYQYLPSFLYFTQKIANAAIIGKMRILWSRNVGNNTCCKHFRGTLSNDSCCCEMLIIIPPPSLSLEWLDQGEYRQQDNLQPLFTYRKKFIGSRKYSHNTTFMNYLISLEETMTRRRN